MIGIILAAGRGIRLRKATSIPKSLCEINGETILERQIRMLHRYGIQEIYIVVGYKSYLIKNFVRERGLNLTFIDNNEWDQSDNLYSLYLALQATDGEFVLLNADIVFDGRMLGKVLKCSGYDFCIVGKREFRMGKITVKGRTILLAILNGIQNWEMANMKFILKILNVHYITARYFCDDIDYPEDLVKIYGRFKKEN